MAKYLLLVLAAVLACAACGGGGKQYSLKATMACLQGEGMLVQQYTAPGMPVGSGGSLRTRDAMRPATTYAVFGGSASEAQAVAAQLRLLGATGADLATKGNVAYWSNSPTLAGNPLAACLA